MSKLRPLSPLLLLLASGCAGYAADYWKPKETIAGAQLLRYGLDNAQAKCVNDRLTASLSVWQLRQLSDLASRLKSGGANPSKLGPWDLRYIAGLVEDPKVGPETGRALDACGLPLAPAPPPAPARSTGPTTAPAEPPKPLQWIDLGAAETGQSIAIDITSVVTVEGRREGWFRLTNPGEAGPQPVSYRLRVDCRARTITPTAARKYDAQGRIAEQRDYGSGGEGPLAVEAGTVMEIAHRALCS